MRKNGSQAKDSAQISEAQNIPATPIPGAMPWKSKEKIRAPSRPDYIPGAGIGRKKREVLDNSRGPGKRPKEWLKPAEGTTSCEKQRMRATPIYMPRSEDNLLKSKGLHLTELLGEGSYSKVYLCTKTETKQGTTRTYVAALKIIDTSKVSEDYVRKFLPREISVILKIKHPHIIKLYLLLQRKTKYYMCMRYAERGDLLEYILANGLITENRARFWTNQLGTAIEYLHTMNVVHRDIKAENVLITEHFNVKLCDFGFCRFIKPEETSSTFCGSISYSPPEVLQTKSYDAKKADMWSLGVVVFIMLLKRLPFKESENPRVLVVEQLEKSYAMPQQVADTLTTQAKRAIKHLLEPDTSVRWSAQELLSSNWLAMDFRLSQRTEEETEALKEAERISKGGSKSKQEADGETQQKKRGVLRGKSEELDKGKRKGQESSRRGTESDVDPRPGAPKKSRILGRSEVERSEHSIRGDSRPGSSVKQLKLKRGEPALNGGTAQRKSAIRCPTLKKGDLSVKPVYKLRPVRSQDDIVDRAPRERTGVIIENKAN